MSTPMLTYARAARVLAVHDGDTITAELDLGFHVAHTVKLRLLGLNAPELHGATASAGRTAQVALEAKVLDQPVVIVSVKTEKYGRWLGTVWLGEENVNEWMVANGHAAAWDGTGKAP